jgi:hypothetical protein
MTGQTKKRVLNAAVGDDFREFLRGSMCLGRLLENRMSGGQFWVWMPDAVTPIDTKRFREDIFYPTPFDVKPSLKRHLSNFLMSEPNAIVIADTFRDLSEPKPDWFSSLEWFAMRNPLLRSGEVCLCAFLRGDHYNADLLDRLTRSASPYPTTLTLTSLRRSETLQSGMDLALHPEVLQELLDRVCEVMVGVFDESSMLVWTR